MKVNLTNKWIGFIIHINFHSWAHCNIEYWIYCNIDRSDAEQVAQNLKTSAFTLTSLYYEIAHELNNTVKSSILERMRVLSIYLADNLQIPATLCKLEDFGDTEE